MVTSDEIAAIPLFAGLAEGDRTRLAQASADIRLAEGEFAVHEDEERALFAVLEGRIEAVKVVDGIPRVLGERLPGAIFGEVPITLGTTFPSGFRASEPSRVMRVEAREYHTVAAAAARGGDQGRRARARAHRRPAGGRGQGPGGARARARAPLGCGLLGSSPLSRPQPDHVRLAHARGERRRRALGDAGVVADFGGLVLAAGRVRSRPLPG